MSISINIELPAFSIGQPTEGDGYMIVARDLLQGVEALSTLPPNISTRSCALIAAQTLECVLKAFLWNKGKKKEIRVRKVQHNLIALWDMAYKEKDLSIPQVPPSWVTILSSGHGPNFSFRYQEGEGNSVDHNGEKTKNIVHGGQTPALIPMADALTNLIKRVGLAIGG